MPQMTTAVMAFSYSMGTCTADSRSDKEHYHLNKTLSYFLDYLCSADCLTRTE